MVSVMVPDGACSMASKEVTEAASTHVEHEYRPGVVSKARCIDVCKAETW